MNYSPLFDYSILFLGMTITSVLVVGVTNITYTHQPSDHDHNAHGICGIV